MSDSIPFTAEEIERFWSRVDRSGGPDACHPWLGCQEGGGYGSVRMGGRVWAAHRVAWILTHGPIEGGPRTCVCHNCPGGDNRLCCNTRHHWLGTRRENSADMVAKGRAAIGERNGSRTRPDRVARGDRHMSRTRPDAILRGEHAPNARLTAADIVSIRERFWRGITTRRALAVEYGVAEPTVSDITHRRTWRHVPAGQEGEGA